MKLIIAGGRDTRLTVDDWISLSSIQGVTEVVSGGARGVDSDGEAWAKKNGIQVRRFLADWNLHGKAAGPIRNFRMAEYADAVALFKGGKGTESMWHEADRAGILIYDFR